MDIHSIKNRAVVAGLSLALGLGAVAGVAAPAVAAQSKAAITVTKAAKAGKYKAYQLVAGEVTGKKISNGTLAADNADIVKATIREFLTGEDFTKLMTDKNDFSADAAVQANEVMDCISAIDKAGKGQEFANALAKAFMTGGKAAKEATAENGTVKFDGLDTGYYLVMSDTADAGLGEGEAMTSAILTTLGADGVTADSKVKVPTLDKLIKDDDGSWDKDFSKAADAELTGGKGAERVTTATYRLVGTMPANLTDYKTYKYAFVDKLPTGLTTSVADLANWHVSVKAGEADVTDRFKATVSDDGSTVTWTCDDVRAIQGVTKDTAFTLEYTPVYSADAIKAFYDQVSSLKTPQVNAAHLEFSNNPYDQGAGTTSHTPDEDTRLYSYNLKVNKVDEKKAALTGAKFTLTGADGKTLGRDITAADDGTFTFTGLEADVEYTLTETVTPAGMKRIQPVKFTIHATKSDDGTEVTSITADKGSDPSNAATVAIDDATVGMTVVNLPGSDMPGTGREGIWMALVGSGLLIAVCGVAITRGAKHDEA